MVHSSVNAFAVISTILADLEDCLARAMMEA
jgi:hypothetical protein